MSELLGTEWKVVINPLAVWPYGTDDFAKERLGHCLHAYVDGAIYQLKYFAENYGEDGKKEMNDLAYKHELNMQYDDKKQYSYCGPAIIDGQLVILFSESQLGTNASYAFENAPLQKALNAAPPPPSANGQGPKLSYAARTSIKQDWDPKIEELTKKIADMLKVPNLKLEPNFESNFAILKENEKKAGLREDWESRIGDFFYKYFDGLHYTLNWKKFGEDDMLQEGFQEAVSKNEIALKVVEKLETGKSNYNEIVIKDGVLCIQTTPKTWDSNIGDAAQYIIDML